MASCSGGGCGVVGVWRRRGGAVLGRPARQRWLSAATMASSSPTSSMMRPGLTICLIHCVIVLPAAAVLSCFIIFPKSCLLRCCCRSACWGSGLNARPVVRPGCRLHQGTLRATAPSSGRWRRPGRLMLLLLAAGCCWLLVACCCSLLLLACLLFVHVLLLPAAVASHTAGAAAVASQCVGPQGLDSGGGVVSE